MSKRKKILILAAGLVQIHLIKEAKRLGYYVITADYLPDNPGHQYADEWYNVSTTDKEGVLALAKRLQIDGICTYASDVSAPTVAYVAEQLGLPGNPYQSVLTLTKKDLFRKFLREHGFNVPKAMSFRTLEEAEGAKSNFHLPVMVKPVDSAGTKGVNKLTDWSQLPVLVEDAINHSIDQCFIIEEFIEKKGYQISGDAFSYQGQLVFSSFGSEFYSDKMIKDFCPLGEFWPSAMEDKYIELLRKDLQRLFTLLNMDTSEYNVEAIVGKDDKLYLLEVAARAGGSLIPQMIQYVTGVNTLPWIIKAAVGDLDSINTLGKGEHPCIANYMLHSNATGHYVRTVFDPDFEKNHLLYWESNAQVGEMVYQFRDAGDGFGELIMRFDSPEQMHAMLPELDNYMNVEVN